MQYNALHGFYDREREEGNHFEIDLLFKFPVLDAAKNDDLSQTVSYEKAQELVNSVMYGPSKRLIETLAYDIGESIFQEFDFLESLTVRVRKLNPPMETASRYAEISLQWPLSASA